MTVLGVCKGCHLKAENEAADKVGDVVYLLAGGGKDESDEVASAQQRGDADQSL